MFQKKEVGFHTKARRHEGRGRWVSREGAKKKEGAKGSFATSYECCGAGSRATNWILEGVFHTKARRHEGRSLAGTDERRGTINHAAEAVTEGFAAEVHEQPEGLLGQTKIGQQLLGVHGRSAFD